MPNENNLLPEHAQLAAVLDNPEAIQRIKEPTEKVQIAAVQKKPELVRLFTNTTEKVQLSAVIAYPAGPIPPGLLHGRGKDVQGGPAAHNRYSGRSPEAGIPDEGEQETRRTGYGSRKGVF